MEKMKIHFIISPQEYAQEFAKQCIRKWGQVNILRATHVVSIGGDGTALLAHQEAMLAYFSTGKLLPIYNIDCSNSKYHHGILTNRFVKDPDDLEECILDAKRTDVYPLQADCEFLEPKDDKPFHTCYGFNEIAVKVTDFQMTHLEVKFNKEKEQGIEGDGCILATPMGKGGYYYNLGGKDFEKGNLGFQTIASRQVINRIIPDPSTVAVRVVSHHRKAAVMRDCNLISEPISKVVITKSKLALTVLRDRER